MTAQKKKIALHYGRQRSVFPVATWGGGGGKSSEGDTEMQPIILVLATISLISRQQYH